MTVLAILCSDFHLGSNPPAARSGESDWFAAMKRPLDELRELQQQHNCPILCAGDIFDSWRSSPELINFALDTLPDNIYAIPGNHDLPQHNLADVGRSAYGTLVRAGKITDVSNRTRTIPTCHRLRVTGFPWGAELKPTRPMGDINVALVHKYVWMPTKGEHPAAEDSGLAENVSKALDGFDYVVSGDNHIAFSWFNVWNCGRLINRTRSDLGIPRVGLLTKDGIESYFLDVEQDVFDMGKEDEEDIETDFSEFISELKSTESDSLDFAAAVRRYADTAEERVRKVLLEVLDD